ncbi:uncharacterized protein LOC121354272 isoform X2 [Pyrgilauda ruficollis]|uniref:uncharacterized protein LOC121354272 isoform X2 n=1 Tax=Pyrgilauda ruficollis TaxID=221976 RepID=UPI001B86F97A|nr:uncharacterized protein LOC121354272 isoform X2 [Pyrgilauda ruficollis]
MEAPGRRCLRGGGAGSGRRAGGAAVSPQRWLRWYIVHRSRKHEAHRGWQSASSTSIFKHRTHAHTQRHKNWEGRGGRGRGGARPRQSYYKTTTAPPSPRAGTGLPRRDPRGSAPRSAGEVGGDTPRTTTTHNNTAAATTSPAACRGSKCRIWVENELKRLPPYSSSSSPRRGCHKLLLKKEKKKKRKKKKKKRKKSRIQDTHTKQQQRQQQQQQRGERSAQHPASSPRSSPLRIPPSRLAIAAGAGGRRTTTTTTTTKTTQRISLHSYPSMTLDTQAPNGGDTG